MKLDIFSRVQVKAKRKKGFALVGGGTVESILRRFGDMRYMSTQIMQDRLLIIVTEEEYLQHMTDREKETYLKIYNQ